MRSHSFEPWVLVLLSLLAHVATSSASLFLPVRRTEGGVRRDGWIVTFKPSVDTSAAQDQIANRFGNRTVRHRYSSGSFHGLAGTFNSSQLATLRSSPFVQSIVPDSVGQVDSFVTQSDTTWGLQRISQLGPINRPDDQLALDYTYLYDDSAGAGVDIYIIDSGININHEDFGGRASWGVTFGGYTPDEDGLGHGTHVAGTAAGARFGVAKKANLIAVRVIDSSGVGYSSDCISGVQWVINQAKTTGRPSVINISIKFSPNDALDSVVTDAVNAGIHVVVSAGNAASDASSQSPARAAAVTTVGASDATDSIAFYSNYGPLVDIFAPGSNITSDWIDSNTATQVDSGTSMASPHVAGLTAYLIGKYGNQSPTSILSLLKSLSPLNILLNLPAGTANQLANNGASVGAKTDDASTSSAASSLNTTTSSSGASATRVTAVIGTEQPNGNSRTTSTTTTPPPDAASSSSSTRSSTKTASTASSTTSKAPSSPTWWWWPPHRPKRAMV